MRCRRKRRNVRSRLVEQMKKCLYTQLTVKTEFTHMIPQTRIIPETHLPSSRNGHEIREMNMSEL